MKVILLVELIVWELNIFPMSLAVQMENLHIKILAIFMAQVMLLDQMLQELQ